jgi:hypothetical protein
VVVPGWKGEAPDRVNAATPRPTSGAATPTPDILPTVAPYGPGPPYPDPKGEPVPSLVPDVPLYPGATEVDGFSLTGSEQGNV